MRHFSRLAPLVTLAAFFVLALPSVAHATNNFPEIVKSQTGAPELPFCDLCHAQGITGRGTVTTPIGVYLRGKGLVANQSNSLIKALATNKSEGSDVDGDGTGDWDELSVGRDPNVADTPAPTKDAGTVDAGAADAGKSGSDAGTKDAGTSEDAGVSDDGGASDGCSTTGHAPREAGFAAFAMVLAGVAARTRSPIRRFVGRGSPRSSL